MLVHRFSQEGLNIALDVNSGSVHILDEVAYEVLGYYKENSIEEIKEQLKSSYEIEKIEEAHEELKNLEEEGMLFSEDSYENHPTFLNRKPAIKAMCLHVAHDCNLRCKYCFASQGDFGQTKSLISYEVGKKALDFLVEKSGSRKNLEVDFFGGEPLMNFEVVKQLVDYGRSLEKEHNKNFRFTITTNGVLLDDDSIAYINENMHNVVLSLDGRKDVNDDMRPTPNGKGSYDLIVPKFQKLVEGRGNKYYYVRGTFTRQNLDFAKDVLHYRDLGFEMTSIEPVVDQDTNPYALREEDLPKIFEEYDSLAKEYLDRKLKGDKFTFFHYVVDLGQGPCVIKRLAGCGAATEYVAVTPEGDIYPCHQFVGQEQYIMGNVMDEEWNLKADIQAEFENANVYTKEGCRECWARFYCSGGCHANAKNFNNDILKPYDLGCQMQRKRTECAIMIEAKMMLEGEQVQGIL